MKKLLNIIGLVALTSIVLSCQDDDQEFGTVIAPANITLDFEIVGVDADNPNGDGTGFVDFEASATDAITYRYNFGDGTDIAVAPSGKIRHRFSKTNLNTYSVTVIASGVGGLSNSTAKNVSVFSAFDDQEAKDLLSGGIENSKKWYLAASQPGHLGVGGSTFEEFSDGFWFPGFFSAAPFEKCNDEISDCLCDDEFTFSQDATNQLTFVYDNKGQTFFNGAHQQGVFGEEKGEDYCFDFDTSGTSNVSLAPTSIDWSKAGDPAFMSRGTVMSFSDDKFMGYYVGSTNYEILELTNDFLHVRTFDALNPALAWYHKFSTSPPGTPTAPPTIINDQLVWSDEFDVDGAPNSSNWNFDIGTGVNGWGNDESQYYTNRPENVIVEGGFLKITAQREEFMGSAFTSARLKTQGLQEFTYGKVEVRAKLPTGGGTWPAIWMLGADIATNPWPGAGEIDIMEHVGNQQNKIFSSLHFPGNSAGDAVTEDMDIANVSTEFHIYEVNWTDTLITFSVDGTEFHSFANSTSVPFKKDFFLIMNVAMGGNFGGSIDTAFTSSSMEVDYIRVYQ